MHVARHTTQELVIVAGTRWVSAICTAASLVTLYFVLTRNEPTGLILVAFFLLFAVIMYLRKTFKFDATRRIVRWHGFSAFKVESGNIPFDDITDIGTESRRASSRSGGSEVAIFRLTIITPRATIPMAYAFSGRDDGYAALRLEILEFVKPGSNLNR